MSDDTNRGEQEPADMAQTFEGYVEEFELARQRGVTVRVLQRERQLRTGPPYVKWGRRIFYRIEAVREWLRAREQQPRRRGRRADHG
jgi:hypothetical protein